MLIAQITDCHIGWRPPAAEGTPDMLARLRRAVDHLVSLDPAPDAVFVTGDVTHNGTAEEYAAARAEFARLAPPVYAIPGNHDERAQMAESLADLIPGAADGGFLHYALELPPLRVLALDTVVPDETGGELCAARLAWLADQLAEAPDRPTLVFMHHPPFATGLPVFDRIACDGGDALAALIAANPQVEAVVCGHVHRAVSLRWAGTLACVTPSTAPAFALDFGPSEKAAVSPDPPACRLLRWTGGGGLVTHLSYIEG